MGALSSQLTAPLPAHAANLSARVGGACAGAVLCGGDSAGERPWGMVSAPPAARFTCAVGEHASVPRRRPHGLQLRRVRPGPARVTSAGDQRV
jgi:hypothetical protein